MVTLHNQRRPFLISKLVSDCQLNADESDVTMPGIAAQLRSLAAVTTVDVTGQARD